MRPPWRPSIRWRLALTSAGLTFAILLLFAVVIGMFTASRLSDDFDDDLRRVAADLQQRVPVQQSPFGPPQIASQDFVDVIVDVGATGDAAVRIVRADGEVLAAPPDAPDLGIPRQTVHEANGYRVVSQPLVAGSLTSVGPIGYLQYGKRVDSLEATIKRVRLFLALGVLGGTALALLAGLAVARRAMRPVSDLTHAAQEVARTRDPGVGLPEPRADDEVAELARTLDEMLKELDVARCETEATLAREREFVADASHELRTPLTSILANLELLEQDLHGEDAEIAESALRSTRRMRRLVGDLLFLARADTSPRAELRLTDLSAVVHDAAAETAPIGDRHHLTVDAPAGALVAGSADDLHRLTLNLLENAVAHTPIGSTVNAAVTRDAAGEWVELDVSDDGPGVPPEVRDRVFERFVRGAGDARAAGPGAQGSGLGLSIVQAVAEAHGGTVAVIDGPRGGARFRVRLPAAAEEGQTSTTTGSSSGRRLSRS